MGWELRGRETIRPERLFAGEGCIILFHWLSDPSVKSFFVSPRAGKRQPDVIILCFFEISKIERKSQAAKERVHIHIFGFFARRINRPKGGGNGFGLEKGVGGMGHGMVWVLRGKDLEGGLRKCI